MRARKWIQKGLLAAASSLMVLLLLEGAFRLMNVSARRAVALDRSAHFYRAEPERQHPWSRGATNALRIAAIGDSFTFGVGVQPYDRYAEHLEWLLNLNAGVRPAEVTVFARRGSATHEQVDLLKEALAGRPGIVVLGICLNDTEDHADAKLMDAFRRQLHRRPGPVLGAVLARSRFLSWLYAKTDDARVRRAYLDYYRRLYHPDYSGWKYFLHGLGEFRRLCSEQDVRLLAVVFPLLSDLDGGRYPFTDAHEKIRKALKDEGIDSVDLLEPLTGLPAVRLQAIPGIDPHPNEIVHRLAAEIVFDRLLSNAWVEASYRPRVEGAKDARRIWEKLMEPTD